LGKYPFFLEKKKPLNKGIIRRWVKNRRTLDIKRKG
jgi:hypothetical protein